MSDNKNKDKVSEHLSHLMSEVPNRRKSANRLTGHHPTLPKKPGNSPKKPDKSK